MNTMEPNLVLLVNPADLNQRAFVEDNRSYNKGRDDEKKKPQSKHLELLLSKKWKAVSDLTEKDRKTLSDLHNCGNGAGEIIETIWKKSQAPEKVTPAKPEKVTPAKSVS